MEHYIFTLHLRCALNFQVELSCRQLGFTAWDLWEEPGREVQLTFGSRQGLPGIHSDGGETYQSANREKGQRPRSWRGDGGRTRFRGQAEPNKE